MEKFRTLYMDSNIISAIIGSITSFLAVWIDGAVKNKRNRKKEFELFKKIFIDIFSSCEDQLSKMEAQSATNTISRKPIGTLEKNIQFYHSEKLRIYLVDDDKFRVKISESINNISDFIEKANEVLKKFTLKDGETLSEIFKQSIKTLMLECRDMKDNIKKLK